jgi:hypothetical protein
MDERYHAKIYAIDLEIPCFPIVITFVNDKRFKIVPSFVICTWCLSCITPAIAWKIVGVTKVFG